MHPFTIKDTIQYICSFLEEKDQYNLIHITKKARSLFTDRELYEKVGWQVLADVENHKGISYFQKEKSLQKYDLAYHFFETDQPSKITKEDVKLIDFDLTSLHNIDKISYDMIKLIYEDDASITANMDNPAYVKFCIDHEELHERLRRHLTYNLSTNINSFRMLSKHFKLEFEVLRRIKKFSYLDYELFVMVEAYIGKNEVQRKIKSRGLSTNKDMKMVKYVLENYNLQFDNSDVIYYASLDYPAALKILPMLDLSNFNVLSLDWDVVLYDFELCERIFSKSQVQQLIDNFPNKLDYISEHKKVLNSLKRLFEFKPKEVKEFFLRYYPTSLRNKISEFHNKKCCYKELFLWAVSKGFLDKKEDVHQFLFVLFEENEEHKLFTFHCMISILFPKLSLKGMTGYQVSETGFTIEKNKIN